MENSTKQCWSKYGLNIKININLHNYLWINLEFIFLDQYFVTSEDITKFSETKVDKTTLNIITILRHLRRLKESRIGGFVYYLPY